VGNPSISISSVQSLSHVQFFATPWTAARQASLSITNSQSFLKLMSIESVMPSNHLIFCHPLLLPSIFPSIRVFSNESVVRIRWAKYWSFSFIISPSNEYSGLISFMVIDKNDSKVSEKRYPYYWWMKDVLLLLTCLGLRKTYWKINRKFWKFTLQQKKLIFK